MQLYEKTQNLLRNRSRRLTLQRVSDDTNLSVRWLSSLLEKNPPINPGVNHIEKLYCYLTDSSLQLAGDDDNTNGANGSKTVGKLEI